MSLAKMLLLSPCRQCAMSLLLLTPLTLLLTGSASAQTPTPDNQSPAKAKDRVATKKTASGNLSPDKWEASFLAGAGFFAGSRNGLNAKFDEGGVVSGRATQNIWDYVGIEEGYTYSVNNLTFGQSPQIGVAAPSFGTRFHHVDLSGLFYFNPRGSRFRPYGFAGVGLAEFRPTDAAKQQASSAALASFNASTLTSSANVMADTGLGFKYFFLKNVGLQVEARGIITRIPTLGLQDSPNRGQLYNPRREVLTGVQATAGLVFAPGGGELSPITASLALGAIPDLPGGTTTATATCLDPAGHASQHMYSWSGAGGSGQQTVDPTYDDRRHRSKSNVTIPVTKQGTLAVSVRCVDAKSTDRLATAQASADVKFAPIEVTSLRLVGPAPKCQGDAVTLRAEIRDTKCPNCTYRITWNGVPGTPVTTSPETRFNAQNLGSYNVTVTVADSRDDSRSSVSAPLNFAVNNAYREPVVACTVDKPTLSYTSRETAQLRANATASECSQISSYAWSLNPNEGTLSSNNTATATYDPRTVRFETTGQEKVITATATVTDDRGRTANCSAAITVARASMADQLVDIVFGPDGARVNNCGKRILWEEVLPKLTQQGYRVALVGHFDARDEKVANLDRQRAVNAARELVSGAPGTSGSGASPSSILVYAAGNTQTSPLKPGLCGTSNSRANQAERSDAVTTQQDQNRRVEVWLLPQGAELPASLRSARPVTVDLTAPPSAPAARPAAAGRKKHTAAAAPASRTSSMKRSAASGGKKAAVRKKKKAAK